MPQGLGGLSIEVSAPDASGSLDGGQLSISSLTNAPLSAILGAFGFGSSGSSSALPLAPSAGGTGFTAALASPALEPLSAMTGGRSQTPLFGLKAQSMQKFVGNASAQLLEDALDAPLSTHLSHSRKSPRLFPGVHDPISDFMDVVR